MESLGLSVELAVRWCRRRLRAEEQQLFRYARFHRSCTALNLLTRETAAAAENRLKSFYSRITYCWRYIIDEVVRWKCRCIAETQTIITFMLVFFKQQRT